MKHVGEVDWATLEGHYFTGDVWNVQVYRFDPIHEHREKVMSPFNAMFLDRGGAETHAMQFDVSMADDLRDSLYPLVMVEVQPVSWMNGSPVETEYVTLSRDFLENGSVVESRMTPGMDPHIWFDSPIVILDDKPDVARSKLVR